MTSQPNDITPPPPPPPTPESTPPPDEQLLVLTLRYADGQLSPDEIRQLHTMMMDDDQACDLFVQTLYTQMTLQEDFGAWLTERAGREATKPPATRPRPAATAGRWRITRSSIGWALAAMVALCAGVAGWWMQDEGTWPSGSNPAPVVGVLIETEGAAWAGSSQVATPGNPLHAGQLSLASGAAQVMFDSSAVVDLVGPCVFEMTGPNRGRLTRGTLQAYVPKRAAGFTVDLPDGSKIIDLGTRYQVDVDAAGRIEVWVLEGSVLIESATIKTTLAAGDEAQLRDGRLISPAAVDDDADVVRFSTDRIGSQQVQLKQDGQFGQPTRAMVFNDGRTLRLAGNAWKTLAHPYDVTPNTVLEAEFRTTRPGEIHAIGFDGSIPVGDKAWRYTAFQIYGSESVAHVSSQYLLPAAGQWTHVKIPVGEHFVGHFDRLMFVCDDDAAGAAESWFRNVRVYERPADPAQTEQRNVEKP